MNEWEEEIEYVNSKWCFWTWKAQEPQFSRFLFLVRHGKWHHANKNTPTRTLAGYTGNVIAFRWSFLGRGPSWHYKLACNNSLVQCAATSPISVQHASWHFFFIPLANCNVFSAFIIHVHYSFTVHFLMNDFLDTISWSAFNSLNFRCLGLTERESGPAGN